MERNHKYLEIFEGIVMKNKSFLWQNVPSNFCNMGINFTLFAEGQLCLSECKIKSFGGKP